MKGTSVESRVWDVVVIGSGATGGWAARELASRGLSVMVLEAGADGPDAARGGRPWILRIKRAADRIVSCRTVQSKCPAYGELDPDYFVRDNELPYETPPSKPFQWIRSRGVNGRLLTWGGIGVRLSDHELRAPEQDGFGDRWPFDYEALRPHFDRIDDFLPVYGAHDGLPQLPDGKYRGTCALTNAERTFQSTVGKRFGRAVVASRGVLARPSSRLNGEPPVPSPTRAALGMPGVSLRADAVVSHILVGDDGRARGVAFVDRNTKRAYEVACRTVAVCASTLESTRILLNSKSRHHPEGLGNSSGVLGRYLMDHPGLIVSGFVPGQRDVAWTGGYGGPKNVLIPRYHNLENRAGGSFLRGYGFFGGFGRHGRGQDLRKTCDANEVPFMLVGYGEMLPRFENRVTLHKERADAWGIPLLEIDCEFSDNEHAMRKHMLEEVREMVEATGGRINGAPTLMDPGAFVHEMGTARMGTDARRSVLNGYAQCWDAPNVFVMDGAAWPTGAWQNPTFAMMAIAGRASGHLADELKQGRI